MSYRPSFLNEVQRFENCNTAQGLLRRSEIGLKQFFDKESKGINPEYPDPYYTFLCDGKAWWEWTLNFLAADYLTEKWDGWYCKALDFINDPSGFKQLRARCRCEPCTPQEILGDQEICRD